MLDHENEYCSFREVSALIISWNAGATTPSHLRTPSGYQHFFQEVISRNQQADILMFGFQELIDLEDKKMTASEPIPKIGLDPCGLSLIESLFKGSKRKDAAEQEHMSHQYRAWRDYLIKCTEEAGSPSDPYQVLHTASMVGLFSCVFVKASQYRHIRSLDIGEIKRGMGGLHGNKVRLNHGSDCILHAHHNPGGNCDSIHS